MGRHKTQKIFCDFKDSYSLDGAIAELESNDFNPDEMGIEKIENEYVKLTEQGSFVKRPWRLRESMQSIRQKNALMSGVAALVGLGLIMASVVAVINIGNTVLMQNSFLALLLLAILILVGSFFAYRWMMHENIQEFDTQLSSDKFHFWVQVSNTVEYQEAKNILEKHGGRITET